MPDPYNRLEEFKDFRNFMYVIWKHLGLPEPTKVQYEVGKLLQHGPRKLFIGGFRGMGKSVILGAFSNWLHYWWPNLRILVTSGTGSKAEEFSTFCKSLIMEMDELAFLRPRNGQRDSVLKYDVGPATMTSQSPSMRSVGITGTTVGGRADIIIRDDIETPENSLTEIQRERIAYSDADLPRMLIPEGPRREIYLGTYQCEQSYYLTLPSKGFRPYIIPARFPAKDKIEAYRATVTTVEDGPEGVKRIEEDVQTLAPFVLEMFEDGRVTHGDPIEPGRYGEFFLMEEESKGKAGFYMHFMLDTTLSDIDRYPLKLENLIVFDADPDKAPEGLIWGRGNETIIKDLDAPGLTGDRFYRPMRVMDGPWAPYQTKILAIDPAGRGADEAAYTVLGVRNGFIYILEWGGVMNAYDEEHLDLFVRLVRDYQIPTVVYEKNFGDEMFQRLLEPLLIRGGCPATFVPVHQSVQKEKRICDTLEPLFGSHRIVLPRRIIEADAKARPDVGAEHRHKYRALYQLTRTMREKGALKHDDRIDVLALGCQHVQNLVRIDAHAEADARKQQALDEAIDRFMERATGRKTSPPSWVSKFSRSSLL